MARFSDPEQVHHYIEKTARLVPGYRDLHRMAAISLAMGSGDEGRILVLGAGGGLELRAFAEFAPGWQFVGVDPSSEMLDLARQVLGDVADRTTLIEGYIKDAPLGPFDGATCLLTLHFLPPDDRLMTLKALRQKLKPGARLIVAHHSFEAEAEGAAPMLQHALQYAVSNGVEMPDVGASARKMEAALFTLSPSEDESMLREAGFQDVTLFYAAFSFRGWIATA
ncbi:MAG: class I SAM-dependent methyltransferase [Maritimibacter sp.]